MNAIDLKRAEFRHYLEVSGVMDALSYALIKLYDEVIKPPDPVAFVRKNFKNSDDNDIDLQIKPIEESDTDKLIKKQQEELDKARKEIAILRQTLNAMVQNASGNTSIPPSSDPNEEKFSFGNVFADSKYDNSLVKKHLTEDVYNNLMEIQAMPTILDCIAQSTTNAVGIAAVDSNCYTKFGDLFESIVKELHAVDEVYKHPDCKWGEPSAFENLNSSAILSIQMSCRRSLVDFPFIVGMSEQHLENVLAHVQNAIQSSHTDDNVIDGEFYKISDVKENEPIFDELKSNELGFQSMNPADHRLWPIGRGLYVNNTRTQSILINEDDHLRFISKELSADFGNVYRNLVESVMKLSGRLQFQHSEKFGWLTMCPSNLGTTLRCNVLLQLKKPFDYLDEICNKFQLKFNQIKRNESVTCDANEYLIELTNKKIFGLSEFDCVKIFYDGMKEIIHNVYEAKAHDNAADGNIANEVISTDSQSNIDKINSEIANTTNKAEIVKEEIEKPIEDNCTQVNAAGDVENVMSNENGTETEIDVGHQNSASDETTIDPENVNLEERPSTTEVDQSEQPSIMGNETEQNEG